MRAYRFMFGVLFGVLLLGAGCTEINNYYDCQAVDDGGCVMRYSPVGDHDGDDELGFDSGPSTRGGIFTEDSKIQDSISIVEGSAPVKLVEARTRDGAPRLISVNLATPIGEFFLPPAIPPSPAETYAIIEFGVGGTAYQMLVDFGVGVQFAMVASRISITAVFAKIPSDVVVASSGQQLALGASIGQGTVAPTQAPTRTEGYHWAGGGAGLLPGATRYFPVPMFAKSVAVSARTAAGVPSVIAQFTDMYNNINYYATLVAFPTPPQPLSNEIRSIYVFNAGATPIYDLRLIYQLGI